MTMPARPATEQPPPDVAALAVVGGRGIRVHPPGAGAAESLRSKAVLPVAGRPIVEWLVRDLSRQGVREVYVVADGEENQSQAQAVLGDGDGLGVRVRFAPAGTPRRLAVAAVLDGLAGWRPTDPLLVLPTDSLFRFDLAGMLRRHRDSGSVLTVAAVLRDAGEVAGKHDVLRFDAAGRLTGVLAKPTVAELRAGGAGPGGGSTLPVNAGMYLVDRAALGALVSRSGQPPAVDSALGWGRGLLPWLIRRGGRVSVALIGGMGGVETPRDYLETMHTTLRGGLAPIHPGLDGYVELPGQRWVHESTLAGVDEVSGRTLQQRLRDGSVYLGTGVRLGRDVTIRTGVRVVDADVGDGVSLHEGCLLERVACGQGTVVGPHARLQDCYLGAQVEIRSTAQAPTRIGGFSVLGDETMVMPGVRIYQVSVYPRLAIPADRYLPEGIEVASPDVLDTLGIRPESIPWPA
jgi:NDP-sugar pyrophosphorylase family protein